ncbi:hypothetical protein BpHYR1_009453 [Brachionus plicatilis]|uniref:Uncharacterized protein n=1 Tax=Brachionus plicatilis TaxID=10195 RepID=A0A3M7QEX1_BRAPC|nr:hypothetical protein BpHYR1_009453 [Brachionus plicatilis]
MKNAIVNVLKRERILCYAHLLNLIIERVFKRFQELARNEKNALDTDDSEIDESKTDLKNLSVQILKMLKKWDSEYLMIERILEQVDNVNEVLYATKKHRHLGLNLAEKNILKLIADFLNLSTI